MAIIQPPPWCADAAPTPRGWVDPRTGELLISKKFNNRELSEFYDAKAPRPMMTEQYEPKAQMLTEAPPNHKPLSAMTKPELLALAEQHGVRVSPRDRKAVLVETLEAEL